jgi:hypothetical protein
LTPISLKVSAFFILSSITVPVFSISYKLMI